MADEQQLSVSQQENLLTLLCFDKQAFDIVRNTVEPSLFSSSLYRDIITRVYNFIDQFQAPPGDHLPDVVEDILNSSDKRKADLCEQLIRGIRELAPKINREYVLSQLGAFIRQQKLIAGLVKAHDAVEAGHLDEAETIVEDALRSRLALFQPGINLQGALDAIRSAEQEAENTVATGIPELDRRLLGPTRKELLLFMGPPKKGKTWSLVNFGKQALLQRWRVLHVSLEMSEGRMGARYIQALFSYTRREARDQRIARFERDDLGRLIKIDAYELEKRPALQDTSTQTAARKKIQKLRVADNLIIKEFPTGSLTIPALRAYLSMLERSHKFVPDILLLDYADLMKINSQYYRHDLGNLYKDLRGLGVERNMAVVTATQANREGASSKLLQDTHVAEDWSKIATADLVLTYSQTADERKLGLARLFVANGRNEEDKFAVLISQAYSIGQFCLDSVRMADDYWMLVESATGAYAPKPTTD